MVTRRTLKRTAVGLLLAGLGMIATGCDEAAVESVVKAGVSAEKAVRSLGGIDVPRFVGDEVYVGRAAISRR